MDVDFSGGDFGGGSAGGSGGGGNGGGGGGDDITSDLLQKFSCMNTTDREVLVQQFKVLLGDKCSESNAEFWLDMNNWNLQAAVCSYFDFESQNSHPYMIKLPSMSFAVDPGFVDRLPPNTPFTYQCIVTNSGDEPWPLGCSLRFCGGTQMSNEERVLLPSLNPGQSAEVKLAMISPDSAGGHSCQWRPATITGQFFGETIFIIINVICETDLLTVTQALSDAHLMDDSHQSAAASSSSTTSADPALVSAIHLQSTPTTSTATPLPLGASVARTIFPQNPNQQQLILQPPPGALMMMGPLNQFQAAASASAGFNPTISHHTPLLNGFVNHDHQSQLSPLPQPPCSATSSSTSNLYAQSDDHQLQQQQSHFPLSASLPNQVGVSLNPAHHQSHHQHQQNHCSDDSPMS